MTRRAVAVTAIFACSILLGSCSSQPEAPAAADTTTTVPEAFTKLPSTTAVDKCGPQSGTTLEDGVLTIATDSPAYAPWFVDNTPSNGKGLEGAVARAVVDKLGYNTDQVRFTTVAFNDALKPGPKDFDFDVNQFTISGDRRANVDFSSPYYAVAQSVIASRGSKAAGAKNLADLAGYRLGAQTGSTSLAAITDTIVPTTAPREFATTDDAKAALAAGEIDALVVDIPTGFHITENELPGSVIVGQFPRPNAVTEFFGFVLEKNSPLTACVSAAVDALYADGTLERLATEWITDSADAPVLE
ncbi:ABC transporter substrate-binding protein [Rhodococcus qingshengii]|uniref:ABC transporter substrate-binding protein n=1 Tax=Rhodococcus qingshengii TaxID=334542 RepID=UPI001C8C271C|nr:transporter substrate-binding domain-containing protein [Rhodococcus qingshengii]MBX9147483.1 amino acid ABC transporter substrate-binding protein [Rhodococcus qingshengii]